jgi:hypothetical protein
LYSDSNGQPVTAPGGVTFADRIERCLLALRRPDFQRHLRAAIIRPLSEAIVRSSANLPISAQSRTQIARAHDLLAAEPLDLGERVAECVYVCVDVLDDRKLHEVPHATAGQTHGGTVTSRFIGRRRTIA